MPIAALIPLIAGVIAGGASGGGKGGSGGATPPAAGGAPSMIPAPLQGIMPEPLAMAQRVASVFG